MAWVQPEALAVSPIPSFAAVEAARGFGRPRKQRGHRGGGGGGDSSDSSGDDQGTIRPPPCQGKEPLQLSVTVAAPAADVPRGLLTALYIYMTLFAIAGFAALEKGGVVGNLHIQAAVTICASTPAVVSKHLKRFLLASQAAKGAQLRKLTVMCKKLTNRGVHTWHGIIGYCLKDAMLQHYACKTFNITTEDITRGLDEYTKHGASEHFKGLTILTSHTFFQRCKLFLAFHYKGDRNRATLPRVRVIWQRRTSWG